ncbi:MAG: DUF4105 domain-containing protein [bacterium]|nr:DUF4105 domain-containing protein [bacterium]
MIGILYFLATLGVLALTVWSGAALWFSRLPQWQSALLTCVFVAAVLAVVVFVRPYRMTLCGLAMLGLLVLLAWLAQRPSNNRPWQPDVAQLPSATITGDVVTVHNIRNCDYRTETDYTPHYYDKTFNLAELDHLDLYLVDWGLRDVAHTMLSFGFRTGDYLCISIEMRKQVGETYSLMRGFFRNYELIYIVADERDLVRLRTNYRTGEDVRLYRTRPLSRAIIRNIFLDYLREINQLHAQPRWYNALTSNCMVEAFRHIMPYGPRAQWHWSVILNGHFDEALYRSGAVATNLPLALLRERVLVNGRAQAAGQDPAFSQRIRADLPGM